MGNVVQFPLGTKLKDVADTLEFDNQPQLTLHFLEGSRFDLYQKPTDFEIYVDAALIAYYKGLYDNASSVLGMAIESLKHIDN